MNQARERTTILKRTLPGPKKPCFAEARKSNSCTYGDACKYSHDFRDLEKLRKDPNAIRSLNVLDAVSRSAFGRLLAACAAHLAGDVRGSFVGNPRPINSMDNMHLTLNLTRPRLKAWRTVYEQCWTNHQYAWTKGLVWLSSWWRVSCTRRFSLDVYVLISLYTNNTLDLAINMFELQTGRLWAH